MWVHLSKALPLARQGTAGGMAYRMAARFVRPDPCLWRGIVWI
jgi:hypothetical protein